MASEERQFILSCESTANYPYDYWEKRNVPVLEYTYLFGQEEFPEDLRETATSLPIMQGRPLPRVNFFQAVLESMDSLYGEVVRDGFAPVMQAWRKYAITLGKEVRVIGVGQGETFTGIAADIDEDGALLVDTETGRRRVMAGDVSIRESTGRK